MQKQEQKQKRTSSHTRRRYRSTRSCPDCAVEVCETRMHLHITQKCSKWCPWCRTFIRTPAFEEHTRDLHERDVFELDSLVDKKRRGNLTASESSRMKVLVRKVPCGRCKKTMTSKQNCGCNNEFFCKKRCLSMHAVVDECWACEYTDCNFYAPKIDESSEDEENSRLSRKEPER